MLFKLNIFFFLLCATAIGCAGDPPKNPPVHSEEAENDGDEDPEETEKAQLSGTKDEDTEEEAYLEVDGIESSEIKLALKGEAKSVDLEIIKPGSSDRLAIVSVENGRPEDIELSLSGVLKSEAKLMLRTLKATEEDEVRVKIRNLTLCRKADDIDCDDADESWGKDEILTLKLKPSGKTAAEEAAEKKKKALTTGIGIAVVVGAVLNTVKKKREEAQAQTDCQTCQP